MILSKLIKRSAFLGLLMCASASSVVADQVTTLDGSIINGTITGIEDGKITIETSYAGTIVVSQSDVSNFSASSAINVATASGDQLLGTVDGDDDDIVISSGSGEFKTSVDKVVSAWQKDEKSPEQKAFDAELEAQKRKWAFTAHVDINGKKGNSERFSTNIGFIAQLESSQDKLTLYTSIDIAEDNDVKSADEIKFGVDYSSFFSETMSWYARMELEQDEIELLDLRATAAVGIGKHVIKEDDHALELRAGLAYRHEDYSTAPSVDLPGLDFVLIHRLDFSFGSMKNLVSINPAFDDFGNYRLFHESSLTMPLGGGDFWTMSFGIANDYNSEPAPGLEGMDTTYFTRLNLSWK